MRSLLFKVLVLSGLLSSASIGLAVQAYTLMGTTPVGSSAPLATVTLTFDTAGVVAKSQTLTQGSPNLDFTDSGGGTCSVGTAYAAGQSCTVVVNFSAKAPGGRAGAVVLSDATNNKLATTYLYAIATGGLGVLVPDRVQTVAGSLSFVFTGDGGPATAAGLKLPTGVALDGAGDLFIADAGHNRIRRVDATSKDISTIAGNGSSAYQGDGGQATLAGLNSPSAVVLDSAGNLYIADSGNSVVRALNLASGIITTIAGTGVQGYSGDNGPASSALLDTPSGLSLDNIGNLYIADPAVNVVREVNLLTGVITTAAGTGVAGFAGDGLPANAAELNAAWNVTCNSAGLLYIADSGNNRIRAVDANGIITTIAGTGTTTFAGDGGLATAANLNLPSGLVFDPAGNLYVSDTGNDAIRKINQVTGIISTVAGNNGENYNGDGNSATLASIFAPFTLAIDKTGNLFISDSFHNRIRILDATVAAYFPPGPIQVGKTSATINQSFENDGNAPLNVSSITVGKNAALDPTTTTCTTSTQITTDQACVVGIQAAPTVAGTYILGSITVGSDASNTPAVIDVQVTAVNATATSVVLTSSANPSAVGASLTFSASVIGTNATVPSGTVTFLDGTTVIGTATLDAKGNALFVTSTLSLGSHPITASYGGDIANLSSVSPVLNQSIVQPTVITVTSNFNPSQAGLPVNFTATVVGTTVVPTGAVTFTDGGVAIGTGILNAQGVANFQTSTLSGGAHAIAAVYPGDSNTAPGTSIAIIQTVVSSVTGTDLIVSSSTLNVGQSLTLTSVVTGSRGTPPTGTVTFANGATTLGTATLDANGVGQFTFVPAAGTYNITSSYSGDFEYAASASAVSVVVVAYVPDFTVTATPATLNIQTGKSSIITVTLTSTHGFADTMALGCAETPALSNCTFAQDTVTLAAGGTATVQMTLNTFPLNLGEVRGPALGSGHSGMSLALVLPGGLLLAGLGVLSRKRKSILMTLLLIAATSIGVGALNGCGGSTVSTTAAGTYTVLINAVGTTTGDSQSIPIHLTVTP